MKHTAQDFKEMLTTGEDKVEKIKLVKERLNAIPKMKCRVNRRKLASGRKAYFIVSFDGAMEEVNKHRDITRRIIEEEFPETSITSSCSWEWTFSEY